MRRGCLDQDPVESGKRTACPPRAGASRAGEHVLAIANFQSATLEERAMPEPKQGAVRESAGLIWKLPTAFSWCRFPVFPDFTRSVNGHNLGRRRCFIHHHAHEKRLLIDVDLRLATYHI